MNTNDTQWIMQLTQAIYAAQQSTASRPVKDTAQDKEKSNFQNLLENKKAEGNRQTPSEAPQKTAESRWSRRLLCKEPLPRFCCPFSSRCR